ncbi:MAG: SH3 domain-containing protein [Anaerolineales bacterium]|jgi:hypothetical protein|nr:SH3 domain-containing protein [Anaerolineales bacterium]MCC6986996.1 SH3 domain-containing protein [Anaerolineales bacterium]
MRRFFTLTLAVMMIAQGCRFTPQPNVDGGAQTLTATPTAQPALPTDVPTLPATATPGPTSQPSATPEPLPSIRITATDGNLYIRRGPGAEYNQIGLLTKGESAQVIGRDVLSKWVQVNVPGAEFTGWVSLLTPFTKLEGDLSQVEAFTFTDWPLPAYIRNCTEHDLLIGPNELYLFNLFTNSNYLNEAQVNPGRYDIYDLFLPGEPKIQTVDVREGETVHITVDGSGTEHLCP